jgi:hypothetical protein
VDAAALDISESSNELLDLVARTLRHGNAQGAPGVVTRSGFMGRYDEKKSGTGTH